MSDLASYDPYSGPEVSTATPGRTAPMYRERLYDTSFPKVTHIETKGPHPCHPLVIDPCEGDGGSGPV